MKGKPRNALGPCALEWNLVSLWDLLVFAPWGHFSASSNLGQRTVFTAGSIANPQ